jgi:hypothetical protein
MTSERRNLTEPAQLWEAAEQQAKAEGKSLSEWVGDRMLEGLPVKVRKAIPERDTVGRPKKIL